jgi:hypothetical protein
MKLRLTIAAIVFVATACAIAFFTPFDKPTSITLDAYQKIEVGMTWQQVHGILGGPPRCEARSLMHGTRNSSGWGPPPVWPDQWIAPGITISVTFDPSGRVSHKSFERNNFPPTPSRWEKMRSQLPW